MARSKEVIVSRTLSLDEWRTLNLSVENFVEGFEEHVCIDDSVEIVIYNDGNIKIDADFRTRASKNL